MDQYKLDRLTRQKVEKKFGSHEVLYSKYTPSIPASAEREYVRTTNAYMRILKEELEKELPKLKDAYKVNRDADVKMRHDSATDLMLSVSQIFASVKNAVMARTAGFGLRRKLELLANMNRKLTVKEWKRAIKATLGIDIREDYYLGDFYSGKLKEWAEYNVSLIQTIPEEALDRMREIVYQGFTDGRTTTSMIKEMQRAYGISRRRAELIARDQTAKLNGQIQQAQQQDAGIQEYIWYTTGDNRVRSSHAALNGKKFSWNNPPDVGHGRRCHPGEDYQCRCIGRPVFNSKTLKLPVDGIETMEVTEHKPMKLMRKPVRPDKTKYSDYDKYLEDRTKYRATVEEFYQAVDNYVDDYDMNLQTRFDGTDDFLEYLQKNKFSLQTKELLEEAGGMDVKAMTEFANAYDHIKRKVPKLDEYIRYIEYYPQASGGDLAWTTKMGNIVFSPSFGKGNYRDYLQKVVTRVGDGWFVECKHVPWHTYIHEIGHNAEEAISEIIDSTNRYSGNAKLWGEIAKIYNVNTVKELFDKVPISGYGIDDEFNKAEWFAEMFTAYIDGANQDDNVKKFGKLIERYLR